jgi:two-component system NarL family response regulator
MQKADPIKVLIADDHPVVREGLAALINRQPDMLVVAEASSGREAVDQFLLHHPDVLLVDLRMPEMDGADAIAAIREQAPGARAIVLTTYGNEEDIHRGLVAGAKAYILKDAPRQELIDCIHAVHAGRTLIPPDIAAKIAGRVTASAITPREMAVLRLVADGIPNKGIATALSISESTVKTHISSLLSKLDAADRTQAVIIALRRGLLRLE